MHDWEGDCVVYNALSGNTHILDMVTGEVLKVIASGPVGTSALSKHVLNLLELPSDDGKVAQHVAEILSVLDELGLIEPVSGC